MTSFKQIRSLIYKKNTDPILIKHMNNITNITDWISSFFTETGFFLSFRWYANPPKTREQLISKLHTMFNQIFNKLLGSHWFKLYQKHFFFFAVEEFGHSVDNPHAHAVFIIKPNSKFAPSYRVVVYALMQAAKKMKIDVFYDNGRNKDWHQFPDSIACVPMYNKKGLAEYMDKEFKVKNENNNCIVDVDNLILDNEIFN